MKHLDKDQILSETQHGFRKFHSCETQYQLLETINNISSSLNNHEQVDLINDMPLVVKLIIALFADNAYVCWSISSCKYTDTLQKDLDNLSAQGMGEKLVNGIPSQ